MRDDRGAGQDQKTIREIVFAANGKIQKSRILPCERGMWRVNTIDPRETATGDLRLHPNEEGQLPIQPDVLCPRRQPKWFLCLAGTACLTPPVTGHGLLGAYPDDLRAVERHQ